jgi:branched-chain amino acid transport system permease protein
MPQLLKLGFFEHWTGGVQGLVVTKPDAPFGLPMSQDMWLYYFTLAIAIGIYIASVNLCRSRSGRAFMAIRDNEIAASAMGVDVALYKTLAFGVSAGITGVAGGSAPSRCSSWRPTATPSRSRSRCSSAWWSAASAGCRLDRRTRLHHLRAQYRRKHFKGLSGAVFGVLLFLVIFLVPHGARDVLKLVAWRRN